MPGRHDARKLSVTQPVINHAPHAAGSTDRKQVMLPLGSMGALELPDGRRHVLGADHLIGRDPQADLALNSGAASRRHAAIRWTGQHWEIHDLGSLNGTFVNGQRLAVGDRTHLPCGSTVRFGEDEQEWTMVEVTAPGPALIAVDTGERFQVQAGVIAVPDGETPALTVHQLADGSYLAEDANVAVPITTGTLLHAAGKTYRFEAGSGLAPTMVSRLGPTPDEIALEFAVSSNEEHVDIWLLGEDTRTELRPRVHFYLLLTLARLRLNDQQAGTLPESSHGWVDQDVLVRMLATNAQRLALDVYRARRQFSEAGIRDAALLIERRTTSKELRLGVSRLGVRRV